MLSFRKIIWTRPQFLSSRSENDHVKKVVESPSLEVFRKHADVALQDMV